MILPNKSVSLDSSALGLSGHILKLGPDPHKLGDLYKKVERNFEGVDQFLITLDFLFVIGKVDFRSETEELVYVDEN